MRIEHNLYESWNYGNTRIGTLAIVGGNWGELYSDSAPAKWNNTDDPNDPRNGQPILRWNASQRGGYYIRSNVKEKAGDMNADFTGSVLTGFEWKNFRF